MAYLFDPKIRDYRGGGGRRDDDRGGDRRDRDRSYNRRDDY